MKKILLFLLISTMVSFENSQATCTACTPADVSQERNMVRRRGILGLKAAELAGVCRRTNASLENECTMKNNLLHPSEQRYGKYQVVGTCENNCLQCSCDWQNN